MMPLFQSISYGLTSGTTRRNFGIHSPCAAVINDNATVCRGDRGKFFACGTARGEKRDVDRFVEGILRQFFEDVFLSFKFDGFPADL